MAHMRKLKQYFKQMKIILLILFSVLCSSCLKLKHHHHTFSANPVNLDNGILQVSLLNTAVRESHTKNVLGNPYQFNFAYKVNLNEDLACSALCQIFNENGELVQTIREHEKSVTSWYDTGNQRYDIIDRKVSLDYENHKFEIDYTIKNSKGKVIQKGKEVILMKYQYKILDDVWNI